MPARTHESNYSDAQRAEIFVRDRATCGYSGRSLWIADGGAAPASIDWIDHITPVARGGRPTLENGVCASWLYNWVKRESKRSVLLYIAGRPTVDFYTYFGAIPDSVAHQFTRFAALEPPDWYLNRALYIVWSSAASIGARRKDGRAFARGIDYTVGRSLKLLDQWRDKSTGVPSPAKRGLLPKRPTVDQKLLLSAMQMQTEKELKALVLELSPYVKASWEAMEYLAGVRSRADAAVIRKDVLTDPYVSSTVKRAIRHNLSVLRADL